MNIFDEFDQFAKNNPSTKKKSIPDQYKILNCTPDSTIKEIKQSYHSLLKKYHPDINSDPNAPETLRRIIEAYKKIETVHKDPVRPESKPESKPETKPKPTTSKEKIFRPMTNGAIFIDQWLFDFGDINVCAMTPYGQEYNFTLPRTTKLPTSVIVNGTKIHIYSEG